MATKIQIRRGTAASWTSTNPTLSSGELGLETDTNKVKIGDGATAWNSLSYFYDQSALTAATASATYIPLVNQQTIINTASAAAVAYADGLTTTDIAEGTNLYFTNQRAIDAASATYILQTSEQTIINTASAAAVAYADGLTTSDVAEGTNLYFTNERAVNAGSATYILQSNQQGIINSASAAAVTYLVDSAPGTLDTLNELAAALNDDASFATTVTNALATKLDASTASATYLTQGSASATYLTQSSASSIYEPITLEINTQTSSYTLALSDTSKIIQMNVGSANNLTIPQNSSVAFPIGTSIDVVQIGAGQTTLVADTNVTINSKGGALNLTGQWSGASLYKRDTNTWVAIGDLTS